MLCPCGLEKTYENCCGIYIEAKAHVKTPEALMRSRYSAYTKANIDYIAKTMRGNAAVGFDKEAAILWARSVNWIRLEVLKASPGSGDMLQGEVEFKAYYVHQGKLTVLHEQSVFQKLNGQWFYTDSLFTQNAVIEKVSRNDLCPCKSGKKYKRCCGKD